MTETLCKETIPLLISVIVPIHNELNLLNKCIQSILANEGTEFKLEILVINDGNIDNEQLSRQITKRATSTIQILHNEFFKGPGGARNTGLKYANGDLIAFLDVDDTWEPEKLIKQVALMRGNYKFTCTSYCFKNSSRMIKPPANITEVDQIFTIGGIGTSTVILHRDILIGLQFSNLRFGQDLEFWYRLLKHRPHIFFGLSDVGAVYNEHGSTKNKIIQLIYYWRVLKLTHYKITKRIWLTVFYILRGIKNHLV